MTFDDGDETTRAEFIRAQCADARADAFALFEAHAWRWAELDEPPAEWKRTAEPLFKCFDRGVTTRLVLDAADLPALAGLRRFLRAEPVTDIEFVVGNVGPCAATAVRTLLPFPRPVRVVVKRVWTYAGAQDAFLAALLSAPVMASATELTLDRVNSDRTAAPLVRWLTKSPFLNEVRSLSVAGNRFTCADARSLVRTPNLRNVRYLDATNNLIGEEAQAALRERFGNGCWYST